jgi:hypothetical protein
MITLTAPNPNAIWSVGSAHNITWSHNLGTSETVNIDLSKDGGVTWTNLASNVSNAGNGSGTFSWTVTGPSTAAAEIRVVWTADPSIVGISQGTFNIK